MIIRQSKKIFMGVLAGTVAMSTLFVGGGMTARATDVTPVDENGVHTVTLAYDQEIGHTYFSDEGVESSLTSKEYSAGDTVYFTSDFHDGYMLESVQANDVDITSYGTVSHSFVMPSHDVTVTVEGNMDGAAIPVMVNDEMIVDVDGVSTDDSDVIIVDESKDVVEPKDDMSTAETYILENIDSKYGLIEGDTLVGMNAIYVASTMYDGTREDIQNMDDLLKTDEDNDNVQDNWDAVLGQYESYAVLYDTTGDYYVGHVDTLSSDTTVVKDWATGENGTEGVLYDDIIYDADTGLVYVPKSYDEKNDAGDVIIANTKIQILYALTTTDSMYTTTVDVNVTESGVDGDVVDSGVGEVNIYAETTDIQLATDADAINDIHANTIDEVVVNGAPIEANSYTYDENTGVLSIQGTPATIDSVDVKMSNTATKDIARAFTPSSVDAADYGDILSIGHFKFGEAPKVNTTMIVRNQTFEYVGDSNYWDMNEFVWGGALDDGADSGKHDVYSASLGAETVAKIIKGQPIDTSKLVLATTTIFLGVRVSGQTVTQYSNTTDTGLDVEIPAFNAAFYCNHMGIAAGTTPNDWDLDADANITSGDTATQVPRTFMRVVHVDDAAKTAIVAIITPTVYTQSGMGLYKITWEAEPQTGSLSITKEITSDYDELDVDGLGYSVDGTQFRVWSPDLGYDEIHTMPTSGTGRTATLTINDLAIGEYHIQEVKEGTGMTLDGYWGNVSTDNGDVYTFDIEGDVTTNVVRDNIPMDDPVAIMLQKGVTGTNAAGTPMGNITDFSGAEFRFDYYDGFYDSQAEAEASGEPTMSAVFATNERGFVSFDVSTPIRGTWDYKNNLTGDNTIPQGTLVIVEEREIPGTVVKASNFGSVVQFKYNETLDLVESITITPFEGAHGDALTGFNNDPIMGGLTLTKADADLDVNVQGDATLENTQFEIINRSEAPVIVNGETYGIGDTIMTISTTFDGTNWSATSGKDVLPYGTYGVQEVKPSTGYLLTDGTERRITIETNEQMVTTDLAWTNDVIRGGIQIEKWDIEIDASEAQAPATLEGIEFTVVNYSLNDVVVDGTTYASGDVVTTMSTVYDEAQNAYVASTQADTLPYGTYLVYESKTNSSYMLSDTSAYVFLVREDGVIVTEGVQVSSKDAITNTVTANLAYVTGTPSTVIFKDRIARGDFEFVKTVEGSESRLQTAWILTNDATGERHVLATDMNGEYTTHSSWNTRENGNVNLNDGLLDAIDNGDRINIADVDFMSGVWFGAGEPTNDVGALPYGTYTIQEVASDTNEGVDLITYSFTVYRNGWEIEGGTIENQFIEIGTVAMSTNTGTKLLGVDGTDSITDTVYYSGLKSGKEYVLEATLMNKDTGEIVDGFEVVTHTFTSSGAGLTEVVLPFDVAAVLGNENGLVVFETLYEVLEDGTLVEKATHEDIEDLDQTVYVMDVETLAFDIEDNDKEILGDGEKTIRDEVAYTNAIVDQVYTVKGELYTKDGTVIATGETQFTATEPNGTVYVDFTFDASLYAGQDVVVFEYIYDVNGNLVGEHTDMESESQTVTIVRPSIEIETMALSTNTGTKLMALDATEGVSDEVALRHLIVGKEYTIKGTLMNKDTGEMVEGSEVATYTFVAEQPHQTVYVPFELDTTNLAGTTMVVFEELYTINDETGEEEIVADHKDLDDLDQTVYIMDIETLAFEKVDGNKQIVQDGVVEIIDRVSYVNAIAGTYTVRAELHAKDGTVVAISEATVTLDDTTGEFDIPLVFDTSLYDPQDFVVFEYIYDVNGNLVGEHTDMESESQTVTVVPPKTVPDTGSIVDSGVNPIVIASAVAGIVVLLGAAFVMYRRSKKEVK